ncbi:hypothetical protein [Demequina mangrovi]|uniref:Uncharacterized protein n=1 Tax=Demequina mangrovi TaxID=1043493 RepID=A0A1H6YUC0_9MICO|nr:hypothetical protein [Demequina mangrovi]SEJ44883.1 hypothetical protein SAMN05421637_1798 [Demequina mangrovi]
MVETLVPSLHAGLVAMLPPGWRDSAPWGYPRHSELALIAGVFGAQLPAPAVGTVIDTVMVNRPQRGFDDLVDLVELGPIALRHILGARWGDSTVPGVDRLRADVVHEAAIALVESGVYNAASLGQVARQHTEELGMRLQDVHGLGPGTWASISFMAHVPSLPGHAVMRMVHQALAADHPDLELEPAEVAELLMLTAERMATRERVLAYALSKLAGPSKRPEPAEAEGDAATEGAADGATEAVPAG